MGNDSTGVKWQIGEDSPAGTFRSMSDPTLFGDPDSITSPNYDTDREADEIAYAVQKVKGIVSEKLPVQSEEVNRRFHALEKRRSELQQVLELELTEGMINNLIQFRETVALGLDSPTFEDRQRWLEALQTTVTVENRSAIVTCRLGGEPLQCYLNFEVLYCRL